MFPDEVSDLAIIKKADPIPYDIKSELDLVLVDATSAHGRLYNCRFKTRDFDRGKARDKG